MEGLRQYYQMNELDVDPAVMQLHWRDIMEEQQALIDAINPTSEDIEDPAVPADENPLTS